MRERWGPRLLAAIGLMLSAGSAAASSKDVYARLVAVPEDSVVGDFARALRGSATPLALGKTVSGELAEKDPVFRIVTTTDTTREYRTYFDLYRVTVAAPGSYEVMVDAQPGNGFFVRSTVVPIFRVLSPAGEILLTEASGPKDFTTGKATLEITTPGEYFVFVGANNSDPGSNAGIVVRTNFDLRANIPANSSQPLASNATGRYVVRVKAQKKK